MTKEQTLKDLAHSLAHTLKDSKIGPTIASATVVKIAAEWEPKWREKCSGASCETWLRSFLNPKTTIRYFERRHAAAEKLRQAQVRRQHIRRRHGLRLPMPGHDQGRAEQCRAQHEHERRIQPLPPAQHAVQAHQHGRQAQRNQGGHRRADALYP